MPAGKCDHAWSIIHRLTHCEIDETDLVAHTAIVLLGCAKCRTVSAFPPDNAALVTPRYRAMIQRDLSLNGWTWP